MNHLKQLILRRSTPSFQLQHLRYLNLHEYQGAELMRQYGINVPDGVAVHKLEDIPSAIDSMADEKGEVVVKSQILAGGRGLGTFTNGLQGGVHLCGKEEAIAKAKQMLGQTLVTKQTGLSGKPVNTLYIARKMQLKREMYFAILLDRASQGPIMIGCSEGGTSIEDLAEKYPEKIIRVPVDTKGSEGLSDADADTMVKGLGLEGNKADAVKNIKGFYDMFMKSDCTLLEVNPLAVDSKDCLLAADAKISFDDNAGFRQKAIFEKRDFSQEDAREVAASEYDLNYIGLDGSIGCMVNGAGLAMATMDIIKLRGGTPANFLDVGGGASEQQVVEAFKILTGDPRVKAILVNIFGGIMKCDVIASGIVSAAKVVDVKVPLIVRLEGTNAPAGKQILKSSGVNIITADDLDDAAKKAVASIA